MVATRIPPKLDPQGEAFVARLTRAAYEVALRHGITGPFADLELSLWQELREVVRDHAMGALTAAHGSTGVTA